VAPSENNEDEIEAAVEMTRSLEGTTSVTLSVTGLGADTTYPAHVHDMPCNVEMGGGHYKMDNAVEETEESNEIWLPVTTNDNGDGESSVIVPYVARPEAQAIVIHGEGGVRLACIDLM
jgi:hypothetical protein